MEEQKNEEQKKISWNKDDLYTSPDIMEVVVINLELVKAKDVFGDKAQKPNQDIINITVENNECKFNQTLSLNHYNSVPDNSKLGKFIDKYDGLDLGTRCKLLKNKEGYYNLHLE